MHTTHQDPRRPVPGDITEDKKVGLYFASADLVTGDECDGTLQLLPESAEFLWGATSGIDEKALRFARGTVNVMHAIVGSAVRREKVHLGNSRSPGHHRNLLHVNVSRADLLKLLCQ
jgi:hypothetical protein